MIMMMMIATIETYKKYIQENDGGRNDDAMIRWLKQRNMLKN